MALGRKKILGLAWEGDRVVAVQVSPTDAGVVVDRASEIPLPGRTLDDPQALGIELKKALRAGGFSARNAIVGLPARDLLALEVPTPPPGSDSRVALEKELEQRLAVELKDLVYSAGRTGKSGERVFVVAAPRRIVDGVAAVLAAAGLKLQAMAPSALAWLAAQDASGTETHVLLSKATTDVVALRDGDPALLRAFRPSPAAAPESERSRLLLEVRRATWGLHSSGLEAPGGDATAVVSRCVVWRLARDVLPVVTDESASGLHLTAADGGKIRDVKWPQSTSSPEQFGLAAALAAVGIRGGAIPWSLVARVVKGPAVGARRLRTLLGAAAAALVLGVVAGWLDLSSREAEVATLEEQVARIEPEAKEAEKFSARVNFGLKWFDARPSFLSGLGEATLAFPEEGGAWATSYSARDGLPCVVACKGANTQAAFALLDRLKNNPNLVDAKLLELREAGGKSSEVSFTISFRRKEGS